MIKRFLFICCFLLLSCIKVNAEEYGCTYDLSKGCHPGYEKYLVNNEKITIPIKLDSKDTPSVLYKTEKVNIVNYDYAVKKIWLLKIGDRHVSAKEYYRENGCPPYFGINETIGVDGYFLSENKGVVEGYTQCIFPSVKVEYDENLEKKDEIFNCKIYSSDIYHADIEIGISINYTKKSISFTGATPQDDAKKQIEEYKKNFDYSKKNFCPVNEFKICNVNDIYWLYPKDYKDTKGYCSNLDSSKKIEVGDTYCKIITDKLKSNEISNQIKKLTIKNFCTSLTSNIDYDTDKYSCINMCSKINEVFTQHNIYDEIEKDGDCSLSDRLISWIANIIKWLKYIAPVIVIIFGILDFIKAMSADKDDEMKKVQSKFIKRLIAAALIFLIPLIIGFVLEQLGFDVKGCGIIKELDN